MRKDHVFRGLFVTGWGVAAGITLVAFRIWQARLHEAEQRALEAERTRDETAGGGRSRSGCGSPGSCTTR